MRVRNISLRFAVVVAAVLTCLGFIALRGWTGPQLPDLHLAAVSTTNPAPSLTLTSFSCDDTIEVDWADIDGDGNLISYGDVSGSKCSTLLTFKPGTFQVVNISCGNPCPGGCQTCQAPVSGNNYRWRCACSTFGCP